MFSWLGIQIHLAMSRKFEFSQKTFGRPISSSITSKHTNIVIRRFIDGTQLLFELSEIFFFQFLQRVRIAHHTDRCNSHGISVCPSVRHVLVFCPEE